MSLRENGVYAVFFEDSDEHTDPLRANLFNTLVRDERLFVVSLGRYLHESSAGNPTSVASAAQEMFDQWRTMPEATKQAVFTRCVRALPSRSTTQR